jgi:HEAT repeat protein
MSRPNLKAVLPAFAALIAGTTAMGAELTVPRDGWAMWQVPAVADAPAWCCLADRWQHNAPIARLCKPAQQDYRFGSEDGATTQTVRIFAHFKNGALDRLRPLAAECAVDMKDTPVTEVTGVSADMSARWLAAVLKEENADTPPLHKRLRNDVTAALAIHGSSIAQATLADIARNSSRFDLRKDVVFWLAHVRGEEGAEVATSIMFGDAHARMREHATFAVAQSKSTRIAGDLIRLANTDKDSRVRSQAWFWLAQKGFPESETAINAALATEKDEDVRQQAVFALSQLPDERATPALIAVAENGALPREDRKQAIFWLAHAGSASALQYLDRVVSAR